MSEYQYYEFQAIDSALTDAEQKEVASLSSRVQLSPVRAVFTYSYGDFRGDPKKLLAKSFDAMLYLANWGSRWLYFRFPRKLVPVESLTPYCVKDCISACQSGNYVILGLSFDEEEGGEWIEGEGELARLLPLRQQILDEDHRVLYLAWLNASQLAADEKDPLEPPVPPGLGTLSAPLKAFVEFFGIDPDLIAVAAKASGKAPLESNLEPNLPLLPATEQTELLRQLLRGESGVATQLRRRLKEIGSGPRAAHPLEPTTPPRRLSELLQNAERLSSERIRKSERAAVAARLRKLEAIAERETELWELAAGLIAQKKVTAYDAAITHLKSLQELARHRDQLSDFTVRIQSIQQKYPGLSGLRSRLQEADLLA